MPSAVRYYLDRQPRPVPLNPVQKLREKVASYHGAGVSLFRPWLDPTRFPWLPKQVRDDALLALRHHPIIKPALLAKLYSVNSLDLQATAASEAPRDQEAAEFARYQFADVLTVPDVVNEVVFPALLLRQSVSELVWNPNLHTRGRWAQKQFYKAIKAKAGATVVYDNFREPIGIQAPRADGEDGPLPLEHFIVFKHLSLFGDDGSSDLIACHNLVTEYEMLKTLRNIHLDKFTSPTIVATYNKDVPVIDADGNETDIMTALAPRLEALKSRTWTAVPEGVTVNAMQLAVRGEAEFQAVLNDLEQKMVLSINGAFLQMLVAPGSSDQRGDSQVQGSTFQLSVWALAAALCAALNRQAVPPLIKHNFGAGVDYPTLSLGGINYGEALQAAQIATTLASAGFPVSIKATARSTGQQIAEDDADTMKPAAPALPGGGGMGFPFSQPARFAEADGDALTPEELERLSLIADILFAVFGEDALAFFDEATEEDAAQEFYDGAGTLWLFWDEAKHPRGPGGRFIKAGSVDAVAAAAQAVASAAKAPKTPKTHQKVAENLNLLTTDQLKGLKAGKAAAPAPAKKEIVKKLAGKLDKGKKATAKKAPKADAPSTPAAAPAGGLSPGAAKAYAVYEAAGSIDTRHSEINATLREMAALPTSELRALAPKMGRATSAKKPRAELLRDLHSEIVSRKGAAERVVAGAGGRAEEKRARAANDEPLLREPPATAPAAAKNPARGEMQGRIAALQAAAGRPGFDHAAADALEADLAKLPAGDLQRMARENGIYRPLGSRKATAAAITNQIRGRAEMTTRTSLGWSPGLTSPNPASKPAPAGSPPSLNPAHVKAAKAATAQGMAKMTSAERGAFDDYTAGLHEEVNPVLRRGEVPTERDARDIVRNLDTAFSKVPPLEEPVTTYRGLAFNTQDQAQAFTANLDRLAESGASFQPGDYQSTSLDPKVAEEFVAGHGRADFGVLLEVQAHHGLDMENLSSSHLASQEREFLLSRNSKFRVRAVGEREIRGKRVKVYRLEQLRGGEFSEPPDPFADPPQDGPAGDERRDSGKDVALTGTDLERAERLLAASQEEGAARLGEIVREALERNQGDLTALLQADHLLNQAERTKLAEQLLETLAPAKLLGRARVHRRGEQVKEFREKNGAATFSDTPTDLRVFDETGPLSPMAPSRAAEYFRSLGIRADGDALDSGLRPRAFQLAVTTDAEVLARVKAAIQRRLDTGEDFGGGPAEIQRILDEAGVSTRNRGYAEMVWRTNTMTAYARGAEEELQEVRETFPVWKYSNPDDGRSRRNHAARNGTYYPTSRRFDDVRGNDVSDIVNCRCVQIPVDADEARELRRSGVRLAEGSWDEVFPPEEAPKPKPPESIPEDLDYRTATYDQLKASSAYAPLMANYQPARTKDEARQKAAALGVKKFAPGDDLEVTNFALGVMQGLKERTPGLKLPKKITMTDSLRNALGEDVMADGAYTPSTGALQFSAKNLREILADAAQAREQAKVEQRLIDAGFFDDKPDIDPRKRKKTPFLSTNDPAHLILHEIGHQQHYESKGWFSWMNRTYNVVGQAYNSVRFRLFAKELAGREVSKYAATAPEEFVAEVFAAGSLGKTFSAEVMEWYRAFGGPAF